MTTTSASRPRQRRKGARARGLRRKAARLLRMLHAMASESCVALLRFGTCKDEYRSRECWCYSCAARDELERWKTT